MHESFYCCTCWQCSCWGTFMFNLLCCAEEISLWGGMLSNTPYIKITMTHWKKLYRIGRFCVRLSVIL